MHQPFMLNPKQAKPQVSAKPQVQDMLSLYKKGILELMVSIFAENTKFTI